jgi:CO dehydrogenase/acetyl-CoA synthase delta subunit
MARDIHRRVAALEARHTVGRPEVEMWINEGDGLMRSRTGKVTTREAFEAAFPNARRFTLDIFDKPAVKLAADPKLRASNSGLSLTKGQGARIETR